MAYRSQREKMVTFPAAQAFLNSLDSYFIVSLRIPRGKPHCDGEEDGSWGCWEEDGESTMFIMPDLPPPKKKPHTC